MANDDISGMMFEILTQRFDQKHRAMLPAGTADGDGQIAAVVGLETRCPTVDEVSDVVEKILDHGFVL